MGRELLKSERRRVTLLICCFAFFLLVLLGIRLAPQLASAEIRDRIVNLALPMGLFLIGFLAYEALIRVWLSRLLNSHRTLPRGFQYVNVLFEMSMPTAGLFMMGSALSPLSSLASALPFLYFLFILLAALNLDFWLCAFAGAVACLQFVAASFLLLARTTEPLAPGIPVLGMLTSPHQYVVKGFMLVAGGVIAGFVAVQIRRQMARVIETLEERDRAVSIFGQHVSPQVADLLLKQPIDFSGQQRNVCVMFLDIRDFTRLSSERSAPEVVEYLNVLFGPMIPIINSHSGIVNKFLGDGFMAVFGAPLDDRQQCVHAIEAALEILRQVDLLNQQGKIPTTRVGIGLHVGQAVTGNVGSSERKEYTVIGDVVNLASRIEQANKPLSSQLLVSEAVVQSVGADSGFPAEDKGLIELKGQPQPVRLYKLA